MRELVISTNMPDRQMYETCKVQLVRNCLHANNGSEEKQGLSPMEKLVVIGNVKAALRLLSEQTDSGCLALDVIHPRQ